MNEIHRKLKALYYNPANPGSYGGVAKLYSEAKKFGISKKAVEVFLQSQQAYSLHKPARRHYARLKTITRDRNTQWQADLVDMGSIARYNGGTRFLLTVIDCFSRYAWAAPVKRKNGPAVAEALEQVFGSSGSRAPELFQTDKGKEFYNSHVKDLLKKHGVRQHFSTHSDTKAAIVERFNRTLKQKMWTYFTAKNTYKWLDILPKLILSYNRAFHRSIKQSPAKLYNAPKSIAAKSWAQQYGSYLAQAPKIKKIQNSVRISKQKATFEKGYLPNWTEEQFTVRKSELGPGRGVYKLEDKLQEPITGKFYPEEIQEILPLKGKKQFWVEKILRKKLDKKTNTEYSLVKWFGWPAKFNSWIKSNGKRKS